MCNCRSIKDALYLLYFVQSLRSESVLRLNVWAPRREIPCVVVREYSC